MRKLLILITSLLLITSLSGCATVWGWLSGQDQTPEPIITVTKPSDKTPLNISAPEPLRLRPIQWIVVTPQNAEQIFRQLEARGQDPVIFGLTDDGYTSLSESMGEVRNFMNSQRSIIIEYKKYYEGIPVVPTNKPNAKP